MPSNRKLLHDGRYWCTIPVAARMLRTSTVKIREAMGRGELEWTQIEVNGKLVVATESLLKYSQGAGSVGRGKRAGSKKQAGRVA